MVTVTGIIVRTPSNKQFATRAQGIPYGRARINTGSRERPVFSDVRVYAGGRNKTIDTQAAEVGAFMHEVGRFPTLLVRFTVSRQYVNRYTNGAGKEVEEVCYETNLGSLRAYKLAAGKGQGAWVDSAQAANEGRDQLPDTRQRPAQGTLAAPAAAVQATAAQVAPMSDAEKARAWEAYQASLAGRTATHVEEDAEATPPFNPNQVPVGGDPLNLPF